MARDELTKRLLAAIDDMQDLAPGTVADIQSVPDTYRSRTPWKMAVRFVLPGGSTYDDIFQIVRDWRDDRRIERGIGPDRLSRIQVRYRDKKGKGAHGEYTLSEIGSWELVISRAVERVGIRDDRLESLIERYGSDGDVGTSYIESLVVWLSSMTARDVKMGSEAREARTPKPTKPRARPKKKMQPKAAKKKQAPRKQKNVKAKKKPSRKKKKVNRS